MDLAVVTAATRIGELIANLTSECPTLRKLEKVRIYRPSATNEARLLGDRSDVIPVTYTSGFGWRRRAPVDRTGACSAFLF